MLPFDKRYDSRYDAALANLTCKGSPEAMKVFLSIHQKFIYNVVVRIVGNEYRALSFTREFMLKLILNINKARATGNVRLWIYQNVFVNLKMLIADTDAVQNHTFTEITERNNKESEGESMNYGQKLQLRKEIEALKNTCLSDLILCLPVDHRIAFVLCGIFEIDSSLAAHILNIPVSDVNNELVAGVRQLKKFTKSNCSLVNAKHKCTCDKRTLFHLKQDEKLLFFSCENSSIRDKIYEMLEKHEFVEDISTQELLDLYRQQPFLNANCAGDLITMLSFKPGTTQEGYVS